MAYNQVLSVSAREDGGNPSFFDGVTDFVEYGLTSAATSGMASMVNTGIALANTFGAEYDYIDTAETLSDWGLDETSTYYSKHKESLDTLGFVATSLIPGGLGVKALRAGLRGGASRGLKYITGLNEIVNEGKYTQQMATMVRKGAVEESIGTVKRKAIAAGFAKAAVESFAAETAVALTMNQNPTLNPEDLSYFDSVANYMTSADFAMGMGLGAGLGGIAEWSGMHFSTKKLMRQAQKDVNDYANVVDEGEINVPTGDKLAKSSANYKKLLEKGTGDAGELEERVKENVVSQKAVVERDLLKLAGGDSEIAKPILGMITDDKIDPEQTAGMFAGARRITRPYLSDHLDDVKSVPNIAVTSPEFIDHMVNYFKQAQPEHAASLGDNLRGWVEQEFRSTRGIAIRSPNSVDYKFFSMGRVAGKSVLDGMSEDESIFVLRHEMGHLTADYLSTALDSSRVGRKLKGEALALSRLARPDSWDYIDRSAKQYAKGELQGIDYKNFISHQSYLHQPKELFADSFAMLDDPATFDKAFKVAPTLTKLLHKNRALAQRFGPTKKTINLATGESGVTAVDHTVADVGPVIEKHGRVNFGKDGEFSIDPTKGFNPETMTPLEANAYWYAWMRPGSKLTVEAGETVQYNDLPRLQKFAQQVAESKSTLDDVIKVQAPNGKTFEVQGIDAAQHVKDVKGLMAQHMRGQQMKDPELGTMNKVRTYNELARVLDVDRKAAQFGGANMELDGANWSFSEAYDPTKPLHAVAAYKRGALNEFEQEGIASVDGRIRLAREHADDLCAQQFGEASSQLPDSGYATGGKFKPSAEISSSDTAASTVGSVQGDYFNATSFFQHVGAFLDTQTKKTGRVIKDIFAPLVEDIKASSTDLTELSVLDSVLRRGHYQFQPSVADTMSEKVAGLQESIAAGGDAAASAIEQQQQLANVYNAMVEGGLKDFVEYSGGKRIWSEDAARVFGKMIDTLETDPTKWRRFNDDVVADMKSGQVHEIKSDNVAKFWRQKVTTNDTHVQALQRVSAAKGKTTAARTGRLYPGSVDTRRTNFVAYVSDATEKGLAGNKSVGIITATDEAGLRLKMQQAQDRWGSGINITTRAEKKRYLEFEGRYSRQNDIDELLMDSELTKAGIAHDVLPEPDTNILMKYVDDAVHTDSSIARQHIEVKYGEEIAALRNYGREASDVSTSRFGILKTKGRALDAWQQQEKVMLNISNNDAFGQWRDLQNTLDEKASRMWSAISSASTKLSGNDYSAKDVEHLEATMKDYGFRGPFDKDGYAGREIMANANVQTRGVLSGLATKANGIVARLMLRMDSAHALVTAMSTPVMLVPELRALKGLASKEIDKALEVAGNVKVPGGSKNVLPSNGKVILQATKDFFTNRPLVQKYIDLGIIPAGLRDVLEGVDGMADFGKAIQSGKLTDAKSILAKVENMIGKPVDFSEQFAHFTAARSAELMLQPAVDKGLISEATKVTAMQSFMRRVNGNYIAAQRPQLFQGWAGQSLGLFQTYQMNMFYNMFRYMGTDKRAAASLITAQTSVFGVQSLPGFDWLNQRILERTHGEGDFYTAGQSMMGDEATEWGMYGLASNFTKPLTGEGIALYTRGDMTPRSATVIPTSLDEIPAVATLTKFVNSVAGFADNMADGAPVSQAFYHALAHNGLNRPLQGLGQILEAGQTTSKGNLQMGVDSLNWWSTATRLMGAKPLDDAIASENFYRMEQYKSDRATTTNRLGNALREQIRSGDDLDSSVVTGFMQDYVGAGGKYDQFERWMIDQQSSATDSQINKMRNNLESTEGRYLQRVMSRGVQEFNG